VRQSVRHGSRTVSGGPQKSSPATPGGSVSDR
jgi:hypothetical protein